MIAEPVYSIHFSRRLHLGGKLAVSFLERKTIVVYLRYLSYNLDPQGSSSETALHEVSCQMGLVGQGDDRFQDLYASIGAQGSNISAGQKQLICLVRGCGNRTNDITDIADTGNRMLRSYDTPIVMLDESTANLDATSDSRVQAALRSLSKGRTVICVAHRLHTISKFRKSSETHKTDITL